MKPRGSIRALDSLYAELPTLDCKGLCSNSCGPVFMSRLEWKRITDKLGREPKGGADLTCPMLTCMGRCSVYDERPMLCRLWGLVESMPCVYGCKPERVLTDDEGHELLRRAAEAGA